MTLTSSEVSARLKPFAITPQKLVSWATLEKMLPDIPTALFFAKAFKLNYDQLSELLYGLFKNDVVSALSSGGHSTTLQGYIIDTVPEEVRKKVVRPDYVQESVHAEILPEVWDSLTLTISKTIADVAQRLGTVLDKLPSVNGVMSFQHMAKLNRQRPTVGDYRATIQHAHHPKALVILDVSGSMSEHTIRALAEDVVALSYKANASLALVSTNTFVWDPNTFDVSDVLRTAEYGWTRYETLAPLLNEDWSTVITIADFDSSPDAKRYIGQNATGHIGQLFDISLVDRPTYLAECVGQLADSVEPLLVASAGRALM